MASGIQGHQRGRPPTPAIPRCQPPDPCNKLPGGAIVQAFDAFGLEARHPLAHGFDRDAESGRDGRRRLSLDHHPPHQFGSTVRRQPGILMNVHPVLRGDAEASQLQLPRSEPDGQPNESSQLAARWSAARGASPSRRCSSSVWAGGALGAFLLLATPAAAFARLMPWLVLFATAVFAYGRWARRPTP